MDERYHVSVSNLVMKEIGLSPASVIFMHTNLSLLIYSKLSILLNIPCHFLISSFQGKSRSTSALCAYIMATQQLPMLEALELIQSRRKMADPNPNFRILLKKLEKSEEFNKLTEELANA